MIFFFVLLGLIFGSFIGALTFRLPKRISIKKGRSFCPECKLKISWYDNIPLVSYIFLGGKCRNCKKKISLRYPLIEASTAILFGLASLAYAHNLVMLLLSLFIICLLVSIFVIDFEHQLIPDELVFLGLAAILIYLLPSSYFYQNLLAGFSAALFLLLVHFLTLGRGMGLGDVKLALFLGAILGLSNLVYFFFASFLTGGLVAFILILTGKAKLKQKIAFGPFLIIGFLIVCIVNLLGLGSLWSKFLL